MKFNEWRCYTVCCAVSESYVYAVNVLDNYTYITFFTYHRKKNNGNICGPNVLSETSDLFQHHSFQV